MLKRKNKERRLGKPSFLEAPWAVQRFNVVFSFKYAFITACHGSSKTQNIQNAITHAQSGKPLACGAAEQVSPVRKQPPVTHRLPIVRLLPRATGFDARGEVALKRLFAYRFNASTFQLFNGFSFSLCIRRLKFAKFRTDEDRPRRDGR